MTVSCSPDSPEYWSCLLGLIESGLLGLLSLASLCLYTILLWTSVTSPPPEEEDRWSFRRSLKLVSIAALAHNIFQIIFLIDKSTASISQIADAGTVADVFESLDQFLYASFVYCLAFCLVKPVVWGHLRADSWLYPLVLLPPALNLLIRLHTVNEFQEILRRLFLIWSLHSPLGSP